MLIGMIWAQSPSGAIANGTHLPWDIPEDRKFFRTTVRGRPLIMGRRTWEASGRRAMKNTPTFVVTRNGSYDAGAARQVGSVHEAIEGAFNYGSAFGAAPDLAWIAGGGNIYAELEPVADILVRTRVDKNASNADVFAPELSGTWEMRRTLTDSPWITSSSGERFRIELLARPGVELPADIAKLALP